MSKNTFFIGAMLFLTGVMGIKFWQMRQHNSERVGQVARARDSIRAVLLNAHDVTLMYETMMRSHSFPRTLTLTGSDLETLDHGFTAETLNSPVVLFSVDFNCGPCMRMMPFMNQIHQEAVCGTRVFGVLVRYPAKRPPDVPAFPVLKDASGTVWDWFDLSTTPTIVALGKHNRILGIWQGIIPSEERQRLQRILRAECL